MWRQDARVAPFVRFHMTIRKGDRGSLAVIHRWIMINHFRSRWRDDHAEEGKANAFRINIQEGHQSSWSWRVYLREFIEELGMRISETKVWKPSRCPTHVTI